MIPTRCSAKTHIVPTPLTLLCSPARVFQNKHVIPIRATTATIAKAARSHGPIQDCEASRPTDKTASGAATQTSFHDERSGG
jgi:hypothetical protein